MITSICALSLSIILALVTFLDECTQAERHDMGDRYVPFQITTRVECVWACV
jgi:hypothetical protein